MASAQAAGVGGFTAQESEELRRLAAMPVEDLRSAGLTDDEIATLKGTTPDDPSVQIPAQEQRQILQEAEQNDSRLNPTEIAGMLGSVLGAASLGPLGPVLGTFIGGLTTKEGRARVGKSFLRFDPIGQENMLKSMFDAVVVKRDEDGRPVNFAVKNKGEKARFIDIEGFEPVGDVLDVSRDILETAPAVAGGAVAGALSGGVGAGPGATIGSQLARFGINAGVGTFIDFLSGVASEGIASAVPGDEGSSLADKAKNVGIQTATGLASEVLSPVAGRVIRGAGSLARQGKRRALESFVRPNRALGETQEQVARRISEGIRLHRAVPGGALDLSEIIDSVELRSMRDALSALDRAGITQTLDESQERLVRNTAKFADDILSKLSKTAQPTDAFQKTLHQVSKEIRSKGSKALSKSFAKALDDAVELTADQPIVPVRNLSRRIDDLISVQRRNLGGSESKRALKELLEKKRNLSSLAKDGRVRVRDFNNILQQLGSESGGNNVVKKNASALFAAAQDDLSQAVSSDLAGPLISKEALELPEASRALRDLRDMYGAERALKKGYEKGLLQSMDRAGILKADNVGRKALSAATTPKDFGVFMTALEEASPESVAFVRHNMLADAVERSGIRDKGIRGLRALNRFMDKNWEKFRMAYSGDKAAMKDLARFKAILGRKSKRVSQAARIGGDVRPPESVSGFLFSGLSNLGVVGDLSEGKILQAIETATHRGDTLARKAMGFFRPEEFVNILHSEQGLQDLIKVMSDRADLTPRAATRIVARLVRISQQDPPEPEAGVFEGRQEQRGQR